MAKRRKVSKHERAYKQQQRRIKNFIKRAEKRGYAFPENIIPKQPKRITAASVNRLKKLTPENLYKKAKYGGEATGGEIVKGELGRKLEKKLSAQRAAETRRIKKELGEQPTIEPFNPPLSVYEGESNLEAIAIISNFRSVVRQYNEPAQDLIYSWLDGVIASHGESDVAEMLQKAADAGLVLTYKVVYSRDNLLAFLAKMLDYLPEAGELFKEQFMEQIEYEEDYDPIL